MTQERSGGQSAGGPQSERYSHEDFLNELYDTTLGWLVKEQAGQVIAELGPQEIAGWDHHQVQPGIIVGLDLELQRAILVKDPKRDFALVLGKLLRNRYQQERTLGLQFGFFPTFSFGVQQVLLQGLPAVLATVGAKIKYVTKMIGNHSTSAILNRKYSNSSFYSTSSFN